MAKELAKHAVHLAPSEFVTWAKLADVYIDLEDFENVTPLLLQTLIIIGFAYFEFLPNVYL